MTVERAIEILTPGATGYTQDEYRRAVVLAWDALKSLKEIMDRQCRRTDNGCQGIR